MIIIMIEIDCSNLNIWIPLEYRSSLWKTINDWNLELVFDKFMSKTSNKAQG